MSNTESNVTDLLILGGGPGGYTAAFRAADLGKSVTVVDKREVLGGVCLNEGCIPSKTLLHLAEHIEESQKMKDFGIEYSEPTFDWDKIRNHRDNVTGTLNKGLAHLAKLKKVRVVQGEASFLSSTAVSVKSAGGTEEISFSHCIIATGSRPNVIPSFPNDHPSLWDSTRALALENIPEKTLIIGGGIIGVEMATVYRAFGSEITVIEMAKQILPELDKDMAQPLVSTFRKTGVRLITGARVTEITPENKNQLSVSWEKGEKARKETFDAVLVAIGRRPNTDNLNLDKTGVKTGERGLIEIDDQCRTSVENIFAIGDVVAGPPLAHKAAYEGKIAAEVLSGIKTAKIASIIPGVAYSHPEIAWVGLTENGAKEQGLEYGVGKSFFKASGRALSQGNTDGFVKLLFSKENNRIIGAGIVGKNAGEMIAETAALIEMGADAEDIIHTIHAHPTLSESVQLAAEAYMQV